MRIPAFATFTLLCISVIASAVEPLAIGSRLELFVDDYLIEKVTGDVKQQVTQPAPKEVVLTTDAPWEGNTCAYYTVFRDGDLFRMYYRGAHFDETTKKAAHREVTCYAESKDGIHWTKPKLRLFEFDGSMENNIVLSGLGTHCFAAFKDENPACAADAKYKGISRGGWKGKSALFIFHSPDGIRWKQTQPEPVITEGAFDSQNLAFWDPNANLYREYHRTFVKGTRSIMTGTSTDFVNWTKPVLLEFPGTQPEQLYTNAVLPYEGAPHLLIGFPTRFLPKEGQRVEPTFMASRDGLTFKRWLDPVVPEDAPQDRTGNRSNYMAWGLVELPKRPNHWSVYASEAYYSGPASRLRRFEYRKDGFVAVRGGEKGGELITRPILIDKNATQLIVNFQSADGGSLRAALETPDGKAIAGYELENCSPLKGDDLGAAIVWKDHADLKSLQGKPVRIRFELKQADLYSLQFPGSTRETAR